MMLKKKDYDELLEESAKLFGKQADAAREELAYWREKILLLRAEGTEEARKSEEYAFAAILNLAAENIAEAESNAWRVAERALKLLRNVLLSA